MTTERSLHPDAGAPDMTTAAIDNRAPLITVIVPVRNEERFLSRTLAALVQQNYPADRYDVLVVDGQSTDGTCQIAMEYVARYTNCRLLENPKRLSSAARNVGIRASRGEIVLIVDGHCELTDREYVRKLVAAFDRSGADCVGRPQPLNVNNATTIQRAIGAARSSPLGHHPDSYIYSNVERVVPAHSVAVAYRHKVFARVGLFDEQFDACEDVELNHRIDRSGLRCLFAPELSLAYEPRNSLRGLFRQMLRYGRGRARLLVKHPDTFSLKTLLPAIFVLGLLVGAIAALAAPPVLYIYLVGLAGYSFSVLFFSAALVWHRLDVASVLLLPVVFVTIHLSVGLGLLWELGASAVRQTLCALQNRSKRRPPCQVH